MSRQIKVGFMKYNKLFPLLGMAIVLSLLAATLSPIRTLAAGEFLDISPNQGKVGDRIEIFANYLQTAVPVDVFFSSDIAIIGDYIDETVKDYKQLVNDYTGGGLMYTYFLVPPRLSDGQTDRKVQGGNYYVYITYSTSKRIVALDSFTVEAPVGNIALNPPTGVVGTEIEITGDSFDSDETITVAYDGDEIDIESGDDTTDSQGKFSCIVLIPDSIAGAHTVLVVGSDSGVEAEATFRVVPELSVTPESGIVGVQVTVSGTGFGNRLDFSISFDGVEVSDGRTDRTGSFTSSFPIPQKESGTYLIEASDGTNTGEVDFAIASSITVSPTTGNVGTQVTVSGIGFNPGVSISIKYEGVQVTTATALADQTFSASFPIPPSLGGAHTIEVTGGATTKRVTFSMEATPPATPVPLKPEMGVKAKAQAFFDWEDVTDPSSPVTYTLEIATDNFSSASSVVLRKEGLTTSEYTLTREERLESVSRDSPYYWHVKAVDGASNESQWSGAGTFYVGGFGITFSFGGGLVRYILIGAGVLVLAFIFFWLGRRTAYY